MGQRYESLEDKHIEFIAKQKMFFVGTAASAGRVNISPKSFELLRVIDANTVIWLNLTGSGNETSAHVQESGRMTLMFCAFEGPPVILRLYGNARVVHPADAEWAALTKTFGDQPMARQAFIMSIDLVQKSCGFTVPLMEFREDRDTLQKWFANKGSEDVRAYWREKNIISLDAKPIEMPGVE